MADLTVPELAGTSDAGALPEAWAVELEQPNPRAVVCRIESIAASASLLTTRRAAILGLILEATSPIHDGDGSMLHLVWANEVLERAYLIIQLLSSLDRQARAGSYHLPGVQSERQAALRLATAFGLLNDRSDHKAQLCSELLSHIVRDLVELFGPAVGDVVIKLEIERLVLPWLRRRALILAASNLVLRALSTAFRGRRSGVIFVSLQRISQDSIRLLVADNGCNPGPERQVHEWAVLDDLATAMGSSVAYRWAYQGGTIAEILIPSSS